MNGTPLRELKRLLAECPGALVGRVPGIFPVDKPSGMTSHDVVDVARRRLGMKRIGHGGTLDPMAEGLLLILAGNATRLFQDLQAFPKTYRAGFRLGVRTDTQDTTGTILEERAPESFSISREEVEAALRAFRGGILQIPPMYSALKKNGVALHRLARKGQTVERAPRPVTVHELALHDFDGVSGRLEMCVSSGFYVRTLIDDLGTALGPGAAMSFLRRTRIGPFDVETACPPAAISPDYT
jgi:tRNA pseudouridine55 synthase